MYCMPNFHDFHMETIEGSFKPSNLEKMVSEMQRLLNTKYLIKIKISQSLKHY
jgi:hypothetical protein